MSEETIRERTEMKAFFTVLGSPSGKARPRVTRWGTYTPKKTVTYESCVVNAFVQAYPEWSPLTGAVCISITAYFDIPKSYSKKAQALIKTGQAWPVKRPDSGNIEKMITDALNGIAYKDDCQIVWGLTRKVYGEPARVEIEITTPGSGCGRG